MLISKTKKYAFAGLCCALFSLLIMALSGCNPTSDPRIYYQATGSWEGTIGTDRVRGIISPDGSYHLVIVDAAGNFITNNEKQDSGSEYIGKVTIVDPENNIGRMTVMLLHPPDNAGEKKEVTFKLGGTSLYSADAPYYINLTRTSDAAPGFYSQSAVEGRWSLSLSETDKFTAAVVDSVGNISGNDDDACQYSGTLKLVNNSWNIFKLDLTFTNFNGKNCEKDLPPYRGLVVTIPPESDRRRLWLVSNSWEASGTKTGTFLGKWAETVNFAPVAGMTIVGERADHSVVVKKIAPRVELDAQGSSDENKDPLSYVWSGTDPLDAALTIQSTGSAATFSPVVDGLYKIRLTVNDGLAASVPVERTIRVEWAPDPFVDCGNGTILATERASESDPYLLWLKDAGCDSLNLEAKLNPDNQSYWQWGVSVPTAQARVSALASGLCGLSDGSSAGVWRLPSVNEFGQIIYLGQLPAPPQLLNKIGNAQWSEGDAFINVGKTNTPTPFYQYWTGDLFSDSNNVKVYYFANFAYFDARDWTQTQAAISPLVVWPVRVASEDEVTQCQSAH